MTHNYCSIHDIKRLYIRFANVYGPRFTSIHTTKEIIEMWHTEWHEALLGIDRQLVLSAFNECKLKSEWPPSIAEIVQICDEMMGLPNVLDCIQLAIRREFNHPIIEKIFNKIGDWSLRHDSEDTLISKANKYYPALIGEFRAERQRKALGIEHKPQVVNHESHGSEITRDNARGNYMRKVEDCLF